MSGYTNDAIVHHGVLDPGIFFIEKPFSQEALMRKLREVLDHTEKIYRRRFIATERVFARLVVCIELLFWRGPCCARAGGGGKSAATCSPIF
jgi:hypothetical protein